MTTPDPAIFVSGASGQFGRLTIDYLLERNPASRVIAGMRNVAAGDDLTARGVEVRRTDYNDPGTLTTAFAGVDRLLFVSSSEVGQRVPQHRNVIEAARRAGVRLIVYTSILHADDTPLGLASEHQATEAALRESGVPFTLLRNGWYTENYVGSLGMAVANGAVLGSAGQGRISSAARADYATAAVAVVTSDRDEAGAIYELAGDEAYTLADLAAEIARQSGRAIAYRDLPEADYRAILQQAGLPEPLAVAYAAADVGASQGGLFDDSRQLSALIGRPTTPLAQSVREALTPAD